MKKRYDEVMEKVEVTDEMKVRIISNLQKMGIEKESNSKAVRYPAAKRYLAIAACFVLLLAGTFALPHMLKPDPPNSVLTVPDIVKAASAQELSELVGFDVEDITLLPFEAEDTAYLAYWGKLAQITYKGGDKAATYRKTAGTEDNSGDYSSYAETKNIEVGDISATLKGDGGTYTLAIWSDGGYSYSLSLTNGLAVEEWEEIIPIIN